ncbi:hypothetical protein FA13DRAFT_1729934 [Coprinellus micaceus]|uniref:Uncharacterized protein n=1 Tax=Coprinellus micaceus TaxID=71717 RepID=A0A4Y7THK1_COPMI|nr:hypothetical protein FA13DRAFT_1729934 [Coprinellus micaceus]
MYPSLSNTPALGLKFPFWEGSKRFANPPGGNYLYYPLVRDCRSGTPLPYWTLNL